MFYVDTQHDRDMSPARADSRCGFRHRSPHDTYTDSEAQEEERRAREKEWRGSAAKRHNRAPPSTSGRELRIGGDEHDPRTAEEGGGETDHKGEVGEPMAVGSEAEG